MELTIDGQAVFVYTGGRAPDSENPAVLFLHGAGLDHSVWALQSRYLAHHGCNVLAVDLPGHGRSPGAPLSGVGEMADWAVRLLDLVGIESAAVVGHSMGALIALECAALHPRRIARAALLGAAVPMPVSEPLLRAARDNDHAAVEMITQWGFSFQAQLGGHPVPGMWMLGGATRLLERAPPGALYAGLAACNAYEQGIDSARRIHCPVLLIIGARDQMTPPRAARELQAALGEARTLVLDGCGHMMMTEQPDQVLDALSAFL